MKLKPATMGHLADVLAAHAHLRAARDLLGADSPKTTARVRLALTSCGGAARHMRRRVQHGPDERRLYKPDALEQVRDVLEANPRACVDFAFDVLRALYRDDSGNGWSRDREVNGGDFIEEVCGQVRERLGAAFVTLSRLDPDVNEGLECLHSEQDPATCKGSCYHYPHGSGDRCGNCNAWED